VQALTLALDRFGEGLPVEKGLRMNRFEREELAELMLRALATRWDESASFHARQPDMGEWVRTAESSKEATRELWEALYRIEIQEIADTPQKGVGLPARRKGLPQQRG
jgi:hypothetical protein